MAAPLVGLGTACLASPIAVPLQPSDAQVAYTVFGYSLFPIHAIFRRFHGELKADSAGATPCGVALSIDVASLSMSDPDRQKQALGQDMLDAGRYPTMHFVGKCVAHGLAGDLTLHGVTRALAFDSRRDGATIVALGRLDRQDWGIRGLPHQVGRQVQIRLTVQLPPQLANLVQTP